MIYSIVGTTVTEHDDSVENFPEGSITVASIDELDKLKMKQLVDLYNVTSPLRQIKRFTSKKMAREKVWSRLPQLANHHESETLQEVCIAKFAGRKLHINDKKNPRKAHTHAHVVWEKLKDGMTLKQYLKAGGTFHDLLIDIRLERLVLK